jgi:hypothetical protein
MLTCTQSNAASRPKTNQPENFHPKSVLDLGKRGNVALDETEAQHCFPNHLREACGIGGLHACGFCMKPDKTVYRCASGEFRRRTLPGAARAMGQSGMAVATEKAHQLRFNLGSAGVCTDRGVERSVLSRGIDQYSLQAVGGGKFGTIATETKKGGSELPARAWRRTAFFVLVAQASGGMDASGRWRQLRPDVSMLGEGNF